MEAPGILKWNTTEYDMKLVIEQEHKEELQHVKGELNNRVPFSTFISTLSDQATCPTELNCLIICNTELPPSIEYLWSKCQLVICADGGCNRLYKFTMDKSQLSGSNIQMLPDFIKGDLDSSLQTTRDHYSDKGIKILYDSSQDTTDLQKAMALVQELELTKNIFFTNIYISGGLGGNLSHEFANINVLYEYSDRKIILFSHHNIAWLLNSNYTHEITLKKNVNCSLIPLASPATNVTTTGLKWNLDSQTLKFGELISTSNITSEDLVTCKTSHHLVFIVDLIH